MHQQKPYIKPGFSYKTPKITKLTWSIVPPEINLELTEYPKSTTPIIMYLTEFRRIRAEKYSNYAEIFTDGSKTEAGVGAAAIIENN